MRVETTTKRARQARSSRSLYLAAAALLLGTGCGSSPTAPPSGLDGAETTIVRASEIEWQALNPARGDASPRAATLWGDRQADVATGFLVRFVDGFSSPPHIHNVSYRGVVISGLVHNDDPEAEPMWMPTGSFWTQPKGGAHITSAKGETIAYIEIDAGPYLVRPLDQAFTGEEKPVNVDVSNLVWSRAADAEVAYLWGDPAGDGRGGLLVKLSAGKSTTLSGHGSNWRAVVIRGGVVLSAGDAAMAPGSYFSSDGSSEIACGAEEDCLVYVHETGRLEVVGTP